jgi:hypothetical protein
MLRGAGAAAAVALGRGLVWPFADADDSGGAENMFSGDALYRDLVAYCELGDHRTGTDVDIATSSWLADELRAAGLETDLEPYTLQQFFIERVALEVGGIPLTAFPLWWPRATGPEPITAPITIVGGQVPDRAVTGRIARVTLPFGVIVRSASVFPGSGIAERLLPVAEAGAAAIVAITEHPTGDIMALNAMAGLEQWPVPIVLVGSRAKGVLDVAALRGDRASLLLRGHLEPRATAYEVVGRLDRGSRRIVVSTPSSGWFRCAGERGPGIALWLAVARWAAQHESDTSYTFVASSGHELDGIGIRHFVEQLAPVPEDVTCWLHLGAGIATWDHEATEQGVRRLDRPYPLRRLQTTSPSIAELLEPHFQNLPGLRPSVTSRPAGETRLMAERGYRTFGFSGGSWYHHMPGDLPDRVTGPEILEPVGQALARVLDRIDSEGVA